MSPTHFTQPPVCPPEWQGDPSAAQLAALLQAFLLIAVGREAAAFVPRVSRTHLAASKPGTPRTCRQRRATPPQLPHLGFSVYRFPGQGGNAVRSSRTKTWCPSQGSRLHLLKSAAAAKPRQRRAVLASQVQASCFRAAPPSPRGRRRPLAAEPGPSCGAPPGAPARCLSRYSRCKGLPAKRGAN